MRASKFPPGWDKERVRRVLAHYERQAEDEAVAEDEAAFEDKVAAIAVPHELVPAVRELIARHGFKPGPKPKPRRGSRAR